MIHSIIIIIYTVQVVMANCARITAKDILATNGVVHVVDKVVFKRSGFLSRWSIEC